jgi:electron transfer flavoprotein beta subunit
MHFVVCVKQVPDTTEVKVDPETNTLIREGVQSMVNPFDMFAVEEAIRLKERLGGKVTALSMGPPQAEAALREVISMGVDEGILLSDRAFAGSDTWATSYALAMAIRKLGDFSLIVCGNQASDGDTGQVGPGIAAHLDLPQITYIRKIEEIDETRIVAERLMEDGYEAIEAPLPCMVTVVKEINVPRFPSFKGKMAAKKARIPVWTAEEIQADPEKIGLAGSPTRVVRIFTPPVRAGGEVLDGTPEEAAAALIARLKGPVRMSSK